MYFNSQPHKEADEKSSDGGNTYSDFNSQPHKEADPIRRLRRSARAISTHSLTRRLTVDRASVLIEPAFQLTASQGG